MITVPAIWTEKMKSEMLEACKISGMQKKNHKVSFIFEPEAAAVKLLGENGGSVEEDENFMVIDAGGGTIDITIYKKQGETLMQKHKASGGAAGGSYVDREFIKWLVEQVKTEEKTLFASNFIRTTDYTVYVNKWLDIKHRESYEKEAILSWPS